MGPFAISHGHGYRRFVQQITQQLEKMTAYFNKKDLNLFLNRQQVVLIPKMA